MHTWFQYCAHSNGPVHCKRDLGTVDVSSSLARRVVSTYLDKLRSTTVHTATMINHPQSLHIGPLEYYSPRW